MATQDFTSCTNAGPITVTVQDGKVVRVRPLVAEQSDFRPWTIEADGDRQLVNSLNLSNKDSSQLVSNLSRRYPHGLGVNVVG